MRLFPPEEVHQSVLAEIREERVVSSRGKHIPRGIRRRSTGRYPVRRREQKAQTLSITIRFGPTPARRQKLSDQVSGPN